MTTLTTWLHSPGPDESVRQTRNPTAVSGGRPVIVVRATEVLGTPRRAIRWTAKPIEMGDSTGHLETYTELPLF